MTWIGSVQSLELISVLSSDQSLIKVLELTLVLNCCWNFCSNDLNWSQFSVLIKVLIKILNWLLNQFCSKGFLKSLIKNKFKILKRFQFSTLIKVQFKSFWKGSLKRLTWINSCSQFWSRSWIELLSKLLLKWLELVQFSVLIKRFFKKSDQK